MGNPPLSTGAPESDPLKCEESCRETFLTTKISSGVTYYYHRSSPEAGRQTPRPPRPPEANGSASSPSPPAQTLRERSSSSSSSSSSSPPLSPSSRQNQSPPAARPLLLFFAWLGAQPRGVAKYRDLYLDRGMDVLLIQSSVMHFLWPRWGLDYGLDLLNLLEEPPFSDRPVLVHATSIGGYTFAQILIHMVQEQKKHMALAQRMMGHVYDSLVIGTLENMAEGLGRILFPRLEFLIKSAAMFYFWLFKSYTADLYEHGIRVFHNSPVTAPVLFFFCENDVMCNTAMAEELVETWRRRGVAVESRKWEKSVHAAHLRCHPEEYLSSLHRFLNSLSSTSMKANI